jgi:hypothetical protein
VIATAVSVDGVQPALHAGLASAVTYASPEFTTGQQQQQSQQEQPLVEGSLSTIEKIMEDGPRTEL